MAVLLVVAASERPSISAVTSLAGARDQGDAAVQEAIDAGALEVEQGRLRFTHPLFASLVYADVVPEERRRVHRRLADASAELEDRARHLALATDLPDDVVAAELDEAARCAARRGAPSAAAAFAEEAVRLTPPDDGRAIVMRMIAAADQLFAAGSTVRAASVLESAAARLEPGPERATVLRRLARVRAFDQGFAVAADLLMQAREEARRDAGLLAALERDVALATAQYANLVDSAGHARSALRLAEAVGDRDLVLDAQALVEVTSFLMGEGRTDGLGWDPPDETGGERHPSMLHRAQTRAAMLKWSDDFEGAEAEFDSIRGRLLERGEAGALVPVLFHLGELALWCGDLAGADRHTQEAIDMMGRTGSLRSSRSSSTSAR